MALNAIRYWVDLKNALKSSGKLHGDVDPSSVTKNDTYDRIREDSTSIQQRLSNLSAEEEILRPALERDLARNIKLESFKLIELWNRGRDNTIKINLSDQSEANAICLIDIHLWIAFNLRTVHKITIIPGNENHQAIGYHLLTKDVRLKDNQGVFTITFFLNKKDYNFDNEMYSVGGQTNSWQSVLEALLRCGQLYVGVNPQDIRRNLEISDLIQDIEHIQHRANSLVEEASKYYAEGSTILGNQKMDEAQSLRDEINVEHKKNCFKLLVSRNEEITNIITVDLHGQHRYEAMWFLKLHLWLFNNLRTVKEILVITGHAEARPKESVLKPMVIGLLKTYGMEPKQLDKGTFHITLPSEARVFNFALDDSDISDD
ncbi:SMR domain-containing protein At5g58720 isoform X1 [Lactuca sativa]|uniref:SMR domain-containing protein At5g58720 isoform X1 n=1 Tax=Lactuca sativa TaxID=4236 RepID=UPI000CD8C7D8|nr:SMR domain-containing protein At5g58720 isoform X1 [Lactuca sativa]XP_042753946.1 SMR domain-containing protein At5g58720 isoform X1 [Lactuca sativa]XP_052623241.1 SMR domain-containing protein At5g58720 isoform X1 [Lactuca sativa]XP_052623242.1 SMR domain-containing protein At5g58720 isoform X1 [Lactuca sativa]XP_052623243.1 SMR domain-containing protein At5g58720 isoform X1 [Lactuca sativa]XP_052623244.1 SMR domain-containing protein At5g58720 isoform X1 [Lactuca sativa]XP_052623245.1 SM